MTPVQESAYPDLVSWLRAQLDADEAHAQKDLWALDRATPGRWEAHYGYNLPYSLIKGEGGVEIARFTSGTVPLPDGADDLHAADILLVVRLAGKARERAEQVLATVSAHRAILDEFEQLRDDRRRLHDAAMHLQFNVMRRVMLTLLPIYESRPGYRSEWETS